MLELGSREPEEELSTVVVLGIAINVVLGFTVSASATTLGRRRHTVQICHVLIEVIGGFFECLPGNIQETIDIGLTRL